MYRMHPVAFIPNCLICDDTLHHTTKKVAVALLLMAGSAKRDVQATIAQIAQESHCSTTTVQQAIRELVQGGYLRKERRYIYREELGHLGYAANSYHWCRRNGGYTMVRKEILAYQVTAAAFCNLLFLYCCAGRTGRAFPSLRQIAGRLRAAGRTGLDMAKSTVCCALDALRRLQALVRHHCRKVRCCFAANSYYLTDMVQSDRAQKLSLWGGPKFDKPIIINQITGAFTSREEKYGVGQFGVFAKNEGLYFDGTGVLVSAIDEQSESLWG